MKLPYPLLAIAAITLALAPASALACDEESDAKKVAAARGNSSTATVTVMTKAGKSCTVTAIVKPCPEAPKAEGAAASKQRRPSWSPGHLIEPDSMKLAPQQNQEGSGEEWVIISSRNGSIHSIQRTRTKRVAGKSVSGARGPTAQSSPNPF